MYSTRGLANRINRCPYEKDVQDIVDVYVQEVAKNPTLKGVEFLRKLADLAYARIGNPSQRSRFQEDFYNLYKKATGDKPLLILPFYQGEQFWGERVDKTYFNRYGRKIVTNIIEAMEQLLPKVASNRIFLHDIYLKAPHTSYFHTETVGHLEDLGLLDTRFIIVPDYTELRNLQEKKKVIILHDDIAENVDKTLEQLAAMPWPHWWHNASKEMHRLVA